MRWLIPVLAVVLAAPAMADNGELPMGDPQETRYRMLLKRWQQAALVTQQPLVDIQAPVGIVKTWNELTPAQQAEMGTRSKGESAESQGPKQGIKGPHGN